jgi:hypothetical protein
MQTLEERFSGHAGPAGFSSTGVTVEAIAAALEGLGFSVDPPLPSYTNKAGIEFLVGLLELPGPASITHANRRRIQQWLDDRRDALNEDLSRILLGEAAMSSARTPSSQAAPSRRGRQGLDRAA